MAKLHIKVYDKRLTFLQWVGTSKGQSYIGFAENSINVIEADIDILVKRRRSVSFLEPIVFVDLRSCDTLQKGSRILDNIQTQLAAV